MSADNYYVVDYLLGEEQFVALAGFASWDEGPVVSPFDQRFDTLRDAHRFAQERESEYGVSVTGRAWNADAHREEPK